jgi:putative spermidine/putrescine transport system substrate-binding protein
MLAEANGGGVENIEPGFTKMKDVVKNVYVFAKGTDMAQYFQQGEAWVTVWTNSEAARFVKSSGLPLKFVYPMEGAPIVMPMLALVKNGPNPKLGTKLIDFLMGETAQRQFAEMSRLGPVNTKVVLTPEQSEGMIYGDVVKKLTRLDWSVMNAKRPAWTDRWNREIER